MTRDFATTCIIDAIRASRGGTAGTAFGVPSARQQHHSCNADVELGPSPASCSSSTAMTPSVDVVPQDPLPPSPVHVAPVSSRIYFLR